MESDNTSSKGVTLQPELREESITVLFVVHDAGL